MLVLAGEPQWAWQLIGEFAARASGLQRIVCIAEFAPSGLDCIDNTGARQRLGSEHDLLIYDAHNGLDPNALAAISGTLCGGGLFVFIVPRLSKWPDCIDPEYQKLLVYPFQLHQLSRRFIKHIEQSLHNASGCLILQQCSNEAADKWLADIIGKDNIEVVDNTIGSDAGPHHEALSAVHVAEPVEGADDLFAGYCYTEHQVQAVAAAIKVCRGHRRRPLVITSDRGRGKSAALGIASAYLMQQRETTIVVTAPARHCVQALFERVQQIFTLPLHSDNVLQCGKSSIRFIAPDELLARQPAADLLLVDEAAAIAASMLEQMLRQYSRVVFATTVHGYEGTGRGFAIRFKQRLDALTPQWKSLQLQQPVRWAQHDPLERWLFDALLLDAQSSHKLTDSDIVLNQCTVERLDRDQLLRDSSALRSLFALLINAHYQTSPNDLRNILDGPNIDIWVMHCRGQLVAAALVAGEGGFDSPLCTAVWQGRRRVQGHLLPQTIAAHSGYQQAPAMRYWRIMRIAVEPLAQRKGLGKALLLDIIHKARQSSIDLLGASFAATDDVVAFWRSVHCVPVRLGLTKDSCSGVPSTVMLCALSTPAQTFLLQVRQRFIEQLCYGFGSVYRDVEPSLVAALLAGGAEYLHSYQAMSQQDWLDINSFAHGRRQYPLCQLALFKFVCALLGSDQRPATLDDAQLVLLVKLLLQHRDINEVTASLALTGKKQLVEMLRDTIKELYQSFSPSSKEMKPIELSKR